MSEPSIVDPYLEWLPPQYKEKYRRYYVNHELIDRDDLKKIERALIKAFRYAFARFYLAKGYRLSREVLERPDVYGPSPGVLWLLILKPIEAIAIVGDSSIPRKGDSLAYVFINEFSNRLASQGLEVLYVDLLDLSSRYRWGDAQRAVYARIRKRVSAE